MAQVARGYRYKPQTLGTNQPTNGLIADGLTGPTTIRFCAWMSLPKRINAKARVANCQVFCLVFWWMSIYSLSDPIERR